MLVERNTKEYTLRRKRLNTKGITEVEEQKVNKLASILANLIYLSASVFEF